MTLSKTAVIEKNNKTFKKKHNLEKTDSLIDI